MKKKSANPPKASKGQKARKNRDPGGHRLNPEHNPNAAGVDVGASFISVAVPENRGEGPWVRDFPTFTADLHKAADWLLACGVTTLVMESTGVYWIPPFDIFEQRGLEVRLVNANALKHVASRKSDCSDARWLQLLHAGGLLRGSFRPPQMMLALRELIRHRAGIVKEASRHLQRMGKQLVRQNLRLDMVISTLKTDTAQRIIIAIAEGERDPKKLAAMRDPRCKHSEEEIIAAMTGNWQDHALFLLKLEHQAWKQCRLQIDALEAEIQHRMEANHAAAATPSQVPEEGEEPAVPEEAPRRKTPLETVAEESSRLFNCDITSLPGFSTELTLELMGELGNKEVMKQNFAGSEFFTAWTKLPPRPKVSGGKILNDKKTDRMTRVGGIFERAAYTVGRGHSILDEEMRRQKARKGKAEGIRIIAHKLARIFWAMVMNGGSYSETLAFPDRDARMERRRSNLQRRAAKLGYKLLLEEV